MSSFLGGGGGSRTMLTADTTYYVATTGSDSNPGTLAQPWATTQHAMDFVASNLDLAGFTVTVSIGAGRFPGWGVKSCVGGGIVQFFGNGTGVSSTTLTFGPNDGVYNQGEVIGQYVDPLAVISVDLCIIEVPSISGSPGHPWGIGLNAPCVFSLGHFRSPFLTTITFSLLTDSGEAMLVLAPAVLTVQEKASLGSMVINGNVGGTLQNFYDNELGGIILDAGQWTVTNNPSIPAGTGLCWYFGSAAAYVAIGSASFTGAATGTRFQLNDNASVAASGGGTLPANYFPGNAVGTFASGGQYSGITDFRGTVATLPSAGFTGVRLYVTDANGPVFGNVVVGGGAAFVPVYSDGTNWRVG